MPHLSTHHGSIAINVKDRTLYAHRAPWAELIAQLPEAESESIYNDVQADFWQDIAPDVAREHGYSGTVYSEGRMGGWLKLADTLGWIDYVDDDSSVPLDFPDGAFGEGDDYDDDEFRRAVAERDNFLRFAEAIEQAIDGARETFAQRLREAVAELNARREAAIVKGDN